MAIGNRYHRVRCMGAQGFGAPYVFDRGRAHDRPRLIPAPYDRGERIPGGGRLYGEWLRTPAGVWLPTVRGGAGGDYTSGGSEVPRGVFFDTDQLGGTTQTALALDSAYSYNSAGDAIASKHRNPAAETLSEVRYFITSYTGTAANVNDIALELRDHDTTTGAGSTLHESKSHDPGATTGWRTSTGWTFVGSANTIYWLVIGDADGNGTDFATILRSLNSFSARAAFSAHITYHTTDGWSATRTLAAVVPSIVLKYSSGRVLGNPLTSSAASTSSTNQRGLRFVAPATCTLFGMVNNENSTQISGLNLWSGAGGPSGSADANGTTLLDTNNLTGTQILGIAFNGTYPQITQATTYRLVYTYSGSDDTPDKFSIGTGADATLRSAMLGGGTYYWTEADGTTDWSNDDTSALPQVAVIVEDFVTASGGSMGISQGLHTIASQISA